MNITTAKRIAKAPSDFTESELHEALDFIVSDDRITEKTMCNMQAAIEGELKSRDRTKLTDKELLYGLNRFIFNVEATGRYEDASAVRAIRDRVFDFKAMGFEE